MTHRGNLQHEARARRPSGRRSPRARLVCLVAVICCWLPLGRVSADDAPLRFLVVVNPRSAESSTTREFLSDAFLKKTTRWPGGEQLRPVDLRPDSVTRSWFSDAILRRSVSAVRNYWQQRIFTGRGVPPPEVESDGAVLRYVQLHPGAVGYVSEQADCREVKVLAVR